ncbi:MAG: hypothetical protein FWH05_00450 [Oscillospiraceae bacterium]|nr:hypothetical protein [Oscillospiraceae bacterium]
MKKLLKIVLILFCIATNIIQSIVFVFVIGYLFAISGAYTVVYLFKPNPPSPEIKYGEFPLHIVYELNGEIIVLRDVMICEFDGFEYYGTPGNKRRVWKTRLRSGNERLTLLKIDEDTELYCWYGSPNYYMGDLRYGETPEEYEQDLRDSFEWGFISIRREGFSNAAVHADKAWEDYNLRVLDYYFSKPIVNSFE